MTLLPVSEVLRGTVEEEGGCAPNCAQSPARRHPFDCRPFTKEEVNQGKYWAKVDRDGPIPAVRPELGPCWLWTAAKNKRGYGSFSVNGRLILVHRISVVLDGRTIPAGWLSDHLCHNTSCVNPRHLEPKTVRGNNRNQARVESNFCHRGHEFTADNTFIKHGSRQCRQCSRIHQKQWRDKQRAPQTTGRRVW